MEIQEGDSSLRFCNTKHQQQHQQQRNRMARSLPHGLYSLVLVVLSASGWFASLWQGDGCNYAIVSGPIVDQLDPSFTSQNPITTLELGFDSYRELPNVVSIDLDENQEGSLSKSFSTTPLANATDSLQILKPRKTRCIMYPEEVTVGIIDSSWTTSRSFAFFGLVLGGAGTTFLACSLCFVFSRVTWRWTGYALLLASLFQMFSLVAWFQTQLCTWNDCGWSLGSISDVCALSIWALSGAMILCHYPLMRLEPSASTIHKDEVSPPHSKHEKDLPIEDDAMVVTHHSYDDDEEYDDRKYRDAELA